MVGVTMIQIWEISKEGLREYRSPSVTITLPRQAFRLIGIVAQPEFYYYGKPGLYPAAP